MDKVVSCSRVHIPAMSTVGFGYGFDLTGTAIVFVGDHRMMRRIGEAIRESHDSVECDVPDHCVLAEGLRADDMVTRWT